MPATLACTQACLWWWSLARIQFVTMAPLFFCNTAFLAATRTYSPGVSWGNVTGSATTTMISISWSGKTPVIFVACTRKKTNSVHIARSLQATNHILCVSVIQKILFCVQIPSGAWGPHRAWHTCTHAWATRGTDHTTEWDRDWWKEWNLKAWTLPSLTNIAG